MAKVVVIGGANADVKGRAAAGFVARTSNPGRVVTSAGGVARNIAHNLALLGVETALISAVGDDANGRLVLEETAQAGVDISLVKRLPGETGTYLAILDEKGEMTGAISDMGLLASLALSEADRQALLAASFIVADCNLESALLGSIMQFCAEHAKRLLIEPVSVPKVMKLKTLSAVKAYAITPNLDQLQALTDKTEIHQAVTALHAMGFANVIVHRGSEGATISGDGCLLQPIPAMKAEGVVDVTGAGDAAVAGLICGLLDGLNLAGAARLGQAAAACKIASTASVVSALNRERLYQMAGVG